MTNNLSNIQIVLVEPQSSSNIGAVCRAMNTMGITKLAIVGTTIYNTARIKNLSVHSFEIYEQSKRYKNLNNALEKSVLSAGTTRRIGKRRKYISIFPEELAHKIDSIESGEISIVFGRESSGLTVEELEACDIAVSIPSSPDSPSLNLAQAVQVITYSIYRSNFSGKGYNPVNSIRMEQVINTMSESLESLNFFKKNEKKELEHFFSDIFMRAGTSQAETLRIEKTFRKISGIIKNKN
ncbi:MAG: RNA methyltransferase [Spirochaetales bacterium]|nr:RNA methyltransferase [Spirochaetales bacterium]